MTDDLEDGGRSRFRGGRRPQTAQERRTMQKRIVVAAIGVVVALFAILNLGRVKVDWIVTSGRTPLIIVIAVSFGLGIAADRLAIARSKRRRQGGS